MPGLLKRVPVMANQELSMNARTGSGNQRYGPNGERLVAGVVPLSEDKTRVLLIQSSTRKGWVLPKGGWELDENSAAVAAQREAWEEAGITCKDMRTLGTIADSRTAPNKTASKAHYYFFEVIVKEEYSDWPEKSKRTRAWHTFAQAAAALAARPELLAALTQSSIKR